MAEQVIPFRLIAPQSSPMLQSRFILLQKSSHDRLAAFSKAAAITPCRVALPSRRVPDREVHSASTSERGCRRARAPRPRGSASEPIKVVDAGSSGIVRHATSQSTIYCGRESARRGMAVIHSGGEGRSHPNPLFRLAVFPRCVTHCPCSSATRDRCRGSFRRSRSARPREIAAAADEPAVPGRDVRAREARARGSRAAYEPDDGCGSAIHRAILTRPWQERRCPPSLSAWQRATAVLGIGGSRWRQR